MFHLRLLWTLQWSNAIFFAISKGAAMSAETSEVLQGTLDLMVLKTLHALGPQHGLGIARRIEQISEQVLKLNEGTVYTSLLRLQQQGWISSDWGVSENNRKARFYSITKRGLKQLAIETENWERTSGVIGRVLRLGGEKYSCFPGFAAPFRDFTGYSAWEQRTASYAMKCKSTSNCSPNGSSARECPEQKQRTPPAASLVMQLCWSSIIEKPGPRCGFSRSSTTCVTACVCCERAQQLQPSRSPRLPWASAQTQRSSPWPRQFSWMPFQSIIRSN